MITQHEVLQIQEIRPDQLTLYSINKATRLSTMAVLDAVIERQFNPETQATLETIFASPTLASRRAELATQRLQETLSRFEVTMERLASAVEALAQAQTASSTLPKQPTAARSTPPAPPRAPKG